jgi:hypothetical protein
VIANVAGLSRSGSRSCCANGGRSIHARARISGLGRRRQIHSMRCLGDADPTSVDLLVMRRPVWETSACRQDRVYEPYGPSWRRTMRFRRALGLPSAGGRSAAGSASSALPAIGALRATESEFWGAKAARATWRTRQSRCQLAARRDKSNTCTGQVSAGRTRGDRQARAHLHG